jgi:hypothetical protein
MLSIFVNASSLENARKPADYYEAILLVGEIGSSILILRKIAPMRAFKYWFMSIWF